ncbi:MarR family transcriptional regulator [Haloferula rosea]|uniref:MarR family transcriptional regulator n=1 Tax=Haloferula rosea TaxID=490093 RepID=A0A934R978_9BACT|nr:helix-turn-helix domain-containing protein [Haloferula rosea]MBK1825417.1 MarR family transcriptional regulator [Haloferula rosea]
MRDEQREQEAMAVNLASEFYAVLAKYLPHTASLGEIQVLTEVAKGMYADAPLTVSEVADATSMNRWSVSRILMRYIEGGIIVERKDPDDSRKNLLVWTEEAFKGNREWSADWLEVWKAGVERLSP